jgi:cytochrome c oxidase assembly protein subunit 15
MQRFRNLAIASTIATFLLITVGGLVRATKSGLGCGTDWPECHGKLVPTLETRAAVIEFSHRAIAGVVVVLVVLLVLAAYRYERSSSRLKRASVAALGLVLGQAVLGAVVVKLELDAESVVLHLATAMALLATLVYVTIATNARGTEFPSDRALSRQSAVAAGAVLALLLVGSYLSGLAEGSVFDDWPLMNGRLLPALSSTAVVAHVVHRYLAALVAVVVLAAALRSMRLKQRLPVPARYARVAAGMFAVEVAIGALNVWTNLNEVVVTLHLATGAAIWGSLVAMTVTAHPTLARATRERTHPASRPALEGTT